MVVETRYAAGDGVLLGAGDHWVLVTDPRDDDVLEEVWALVSRARPATGSVTEEVLAVLEKAFEGDPPALAVVDLSSGGSASVSRGRGHVRVVGADRILSLDGGADPRPPRPDPSPRGRRGRRLARRGPAAGAPGRRRPRRPPCPHRPPAPGMIDGIPAAILAATGPEGPPPPAASPGGGRARAGVGGHRVAARHHRARPGVHGAHPRGRPHDHPAPAPWPATAASRRPTTTTAPRCTGPAPAPHLRHGTHETVLAVSCPQGHLTSPSLPACRVCHQRVAPQEPRRVPRPTLGGLRLPTGEVVPLDRGVVLGRKPAPLEGTGDWPHLVHLPSDHTFVSRMHLHIELDGWQVLARDLDSRGGTMLTMPGREPERMRAGEAYVLEPGAPLDLAEVYEVRFEVGSGGRAR